MISSVPFNSSFMISSMISSVDPFSVDRHCIVRSNDSYFAFPAIAVREITYAPTLSITPGCHPLLAGICHFRSEFLPVIRLNLFFASDQSENTDAQKLLILGNVSGNWAIVVSDVVALASLETLTSGDMQLDETASGVVLGTAMYRQEVVRVLDPNRLHQLAQTQMERHWHALTSQPDLSGTK